MRNLLFRPSRPMISLGLSLLALSSVSTSQVLIPAGAQNQEAKNQAPQPAASSDIQKLRDEIQLKAMEEVSDKISLVSSDLYAEASKGNPAASELSHPHKQAAKLLPGGVTAASDISWSSNPQPSRTWLNVFASELDNWFPLFTEEMSTVLIPADKQAAVGDKWDKIQSDLQDAQQQHAQLTTLLSADPFDSATTAGAARSLYLRMEAMKQLISNIYEVISETNTRIDSVPSTWTKVGAPEAQSTTTDPVSHSGVTATQLQGVSNKSTAGLSDLHESTVKMARTSRELIGELERWNLLWGQPPADTSNSGMLWGGGLSKEEVLSQYRNLPLTVFTSPNYVKFFSYRLPPRKKYLLIYTRQLGQQINILARALNEIDLPDDSKASWSPAWVEIQDLSKDMASRYINLLNLIENTSDDRLKMNIRADQLTFGEPMAAVYQDVDKIATLLKQLNQSLKQPGKPSEKAT